MAAGIIGVMLAGQTITVDANATIDISGGGERSPVAAAKYSPPIANGNKTMSGQGFISGRGGSTDTLYTPLLTFNRVLAQRSARRRCRPIRSMPLCLGW